jgi:hypothetical protein
MKLLLAMVLVFPALAFAQKPAPRAPTAAYSSSGGGEGTFGLGFTQGAVNFGAQYGKKSDGYDLGGYFFLQTDKEKSGTKIVNQVMSFGGQLKMHVAETSSVDVYVAPGFGIHMIKDVADASASSGKTDVTAFGPTMKVGAMIAMSSTMKIGLERTEIWNWFDEKAVSSAAFMSAAMALTF